MFKFYLKCIVFCSIISSLSIANIQPTLCDAAPIDFNKLNVTQQDFNELCIRSDTDNLMKKIKDDKELNKEVKFTTAFNLSALIDIFGVKNNECVKFGKAVQSLNFKEILECLNFDISRDITLDMISGPGLLHEAIVIFQQKTKSLIEYNIFLEVNNILIKEVKIFEQNRDNVNADLLKKIHGNIAFRYERIEQKELLLEKIKNKDWQAALQLTKDANIWKAKLFTEAINVLHNEMFVEKQKDPNGEFLNKLKTLLRRLDKKGTSGKNWEEIARAIKDKDWNNAIKFARIC